MREDRRSLIDLLCGTTVIYAWDAKSYQMASNEIARESPYGGVNIESATFSDDDDSYSEGIPLVPSSSRQSRSRPVKSRASNRVPRSPEEGMHFARAD
jgi:hypothetical protein